MKAGELLAKNVKYLCTKQKRSIGSVERASGVAIGYLSRVSAGHANPTVETAEGFATILNEDIGRLLTEDLSIEEKVKKREWIRISDDKPPCGKCLEVITRDNTMGGKIEHKYPVWYLERPYEKGYSFFFGDTNNPLLPDYSEVLAWRYMHDDYERINFDD